MKFILSILALLAIAFLVGCSAKDTNNNKLSNSEITKLGKKYGGVYVFNKKYYEEIQERERERRAYELSVLDRVKSDEEMRVELRGFDQKFPQTLSNGKKYYTDTADYSREYSKQPKVPEIYKERIRNLIGKENLDKIPGIGLGSFYSDEEGNITPITMYIQYSDKVKSYGLFGDEGRGFSLSRRDIKDVGGDSIFYLEDTERK